MRLLFGTTLHLYLYLFKNRWEKLNFLLLTKKKFVTNCNTWFTTRITSTS